MLPPLPWAPPWIVLQVGGSREVERTETDPSNSGWKGEGRLHAGAQSIGSHTITSLGVKSSAALSSWCFTGAEGPITGLTGVSLPPSLEACVTACCERA